MVDRDYEFTMTEHHFEQLMSYKAIRIQPNLLMELRFDIDYNQMILDVREYTLAQHLADDEYTGYREVSHPETTWQMFKATNQNKWWLRWLVQRRPVRYHTQELAVTVKVGRYLKYPEHELHIEKLGRPVIHEQIERVR